jgi:hypothetical protein
MAATHQPRLAPVFYPHYEKRSLACCAKEANENQLALETAIV